MPRLVPKKKTDTVRLSTERRAQWGEGEWEWEGEGGHTAPWSPRPGQRGPRATEHTFSLYASEDLLHLISDIDPAIR